MYIHGAMTWTRKTEIRMPTWQGWLVLIACGCLLAVLGVQQMYPFLAENRPIEQAEMVIIEGWMGDSALQEATASLHPGQRVLCAGGPIVFGRDLLPFDDYAQISAARLEALGFPGDRILTAPAPFVHRDRTYASALAARRKLEDEGLFGVAVNLYSVGAHARRSRLLFRKVFGSDYPLGVISLSPEEYDLDNWYRHSLGVKHVVMEFLAWGHTRLFFKASK